jgi:hypothetical protein
LSDLIYTFDGPDDARLYLRQIGTLWAAWVVALVGLLIAHAFVLIVWGVVAVVGLLLLARPIQARAERVVPENQVEGGAVNTALRGGTTRDRALRELAYGTAPMRVALETAGLSQRWVVTRHLVVAVTLLGMAYVVFGPRP